MALKALFIKLKESGLHAQSVLPEALGTRLTLRLLHLKLVEIG